MDDQTLPMRKRPIYKYLVLETFVTAVAMQGIMAVYTNFAVEAASLQGDQLGVIQSVREIPGLLSITLMAFLLLFSEMRLMSISIMLVGVGISLMGFFPSYAGIMCCWLIASVGFHYFESINQSLTLQHFDRHESPLIIGSLRAVNAAGSFAIGLLIFFLAGMLPYKCLFVLIGAGCLFGGAWGLTRKDIPAKGEPQKSGLVFRKKYWLYYALTLLSGARRQIFVVFSVLLLVEKLGFSLRAMALLFLLNHLINWVLNHFIGKTINSFGEQKLLAAKYLLLALVFVAYAYSSSAVLVTVLYVVEQLLFNFTVAIRTFFQKIADTQDIAPSMAMGLTINHVAAVIVPVIGGALWMYDYRIPFFMGVGFALCSLAVVPFMNSQIRKAENLK